MRENEVYDREWSIRGRMGLTTKNDVHDAELGS